jgi:hypothetical protein
MSSISGISSASGSSSSGPSVQSQIAALNRRVDAARKGLESVTGSDMDPAQKEQLSASYQMQIDLLMAQIQALQQQSQLRDSLQQAASMQADATSAAQQDAQAAKSAESQAALGTPRSGAAGSIVDVYV